MGRHYPKGSKRPDPKLKRHQDPRHGQRPLEGGVPWPEFHGGVMYADHLKRVTHQDLPDLPGSIQWLEWGHPDGSYMSGDDRTTKGKYPKTRPGAWFAIVSWDDRAAHPEDVKVLLTHLVPLDLEP